MTKDEQSTLLCAALAREMRALGSVIDSLAGLLSGDEAFALTHLERLQDFDLLLQHVNESADLLERLSDGMHAHEALSRVRLERMQDRLRATLKAA